MIVVPSMILRHLMEQVVAATHNLVDETGERVVVNTIGEKEMRMAAVTALQIVTGEPIWPGDRQIVFKTPDQEYGIFRVQR